MAAYKDEQCGTWYVSFHYYDWTGKKLPESQERFQDQKKAAEWEHHFRMKEAADLDMIFGELIFFLSNDLNMVLVPCKLMQ